MTLDEVLTVSFTLFAVIDIIGSIPLLLSLKEKMGGINELKASLISGALMIFFLFVGEKFLGVLGVDVKSFAVGGSIVIFILGLEMVLGIEFFKGDADPKSGTVVPIAFPLIAGSGTLTKDLTGTLILSGTSSSYTGIVNVSNGIVNVQSNDGLGTTAGNTVVSDNATLQVQNNINSAEPISIGGLGVSSLGAIRSI